MNSQCSIASQLLGLDLYSNSMTIFVVSIVNYPNWVFSIFPVAFLNAFFLVPRLERPGSPITGSGNEKLVYDVYLFIYACLWRLFTFPRFQNVSKLPKFEFLSAKCSYSGFSGVEFRLRSPEVERKYSEGCSDRILKPIQMWYIYTLFDGLAYNTCGYFASYVVFFRAPRGEEKYEQCAKCPLV